MTLALAVDTTNEHGSIAIADDEIGVREETPVHAPEGFSRVLFGEIQSLLARQNLSLEQIDIYAGASGPGSFTGVRVGLTAMKGLAEVNGKKVVAVSNLAALAALGKTNTRAVIIDAKRGEIFAAVYNAEGIEIIKEQVLPLKTFLTLLPLGPIEWISEGLGMYAPAGSEIYEAPKEIAGAIARIALCSEPKDPAAIEANYVRRSDAEIFWKEA
ncbi:MAG TPA: tRNA (adenosine(37)-N6)-threonylcarbamoyltransferase complex dimerization subunit type 1 TsaB [Bryobacteraceae bacterium]|jgi:tRNA threonylcarbamoyladenosine biosynthesis protein TsaB|nr:tRNA (adenosine(37)-N6)-threonylcarbamoyltransferase complex dimerization subunit type 1 TsaB [Bryobacteraceae bacterium]